MSLTGDPHALMSATAALLKIQDDKIKELENEIAILKEGKEGEGFKPIETFSLKEGETALFVYWAYRQHPLPPVQAYGLGFYLGDDCEGRRMFKVAGGIESPTHWSELPSFPWIANPYD